MHVNCLQPFAAGSRLEGLLHPWSTTLAETEIP